MMPAVMKGVAVISTKGFWRDFGLKMQRTESNVLQGVT